MSQYIIGKLVEGKMVWLLRQYPEFAWGPREQAMRFPTQRDASNFVGRLRRSADTAVQITEIISD